MPEYRRLKLDQATYFFTVVTYHRRPWFEHASHRRWLGHSLRQARRRFPFDIDAIVLLPDHLHVLMQPGVGVDYSAIWRLIKTVFTRRLLAQKVRRTEMVHQDAPYDREALTGRRSNERSVWQRRFFEHTIRDEEDWRRHADYIHLNPVKHQHVDEPGDWKWSSIHRFIRNGWLDPNWPGSSPVDLPTVEE